MKKSNSKSKAQSAFLGVAFVLLIALIGCNQTGGVGGKPTPPPTPKPKHAITFSVESTTPNGTLKAKVDGGDIASGNEVEEGKTVTFTATPEATYRVKGWTLDGKPITEVGTSTEYKLKVTQAATVKVSFEEIPKHAITFSVDSTTPNGTLKAKVDGGDIASGNEVEEGKTVTFTATPEATYRVKGWTLDGKPITEVGTSTEYKLKVTQAATVKVSFEEIPKHAITFSVDSTTPNGTLKAKADGIDETSTSPITVEEGKTVTFTAEPSANYKVKEWKVGDTVVTGNKTNTYTHTVKKAVTVKVSFESDGTTPTPKPNQAILTLDPNKLTIRVRAKTEDGSDIAVEGCNETTLRSDKYTELQAKGTVVILKGNITELYCSYNKLTALKVQGLTALQKLECSYNKLTALNVSGLTALQKLCCNGSEAHRYLSELNVQGCTALKDLYCQHNRLTALNVQGLTSLQDLLCSYNKLTSLDVQGCAFLQYLGCDWNKLTALNVQGLTALRELSCESNQLSALNVQGLTELRKFYCCGNQINAKLMTKLLNALPTRNSGDNARVVLYTEKTGVEEGNHKDFSQPAELKAAFDGAKKRGWTLKKIDAYGNDVVL
ncbi:MAG: InlB B-repeat-containing protein [Treponema sp.]